MKYLLAFIFCLSCCGVCHADLVIKIGPEKDGFQATLTNPTDAEVVRLQAIQSQQVLIKLASKGCEKKSLLKKLFGS